MTLPRRVLITGAAGNLGSKLRRHLDGRCELVLLDIRATGDGILGADLSQWDENWVKAFQGAEAVVHLAGNPLAYAAWPELVAPNIDAMLNVYEASARAGVGRFIFASSNHVMGGYQTEPNVRITPHLPPRPGLRYITGGAERESHAYGTTKLFGERTGKHYSETRAMVVIALRIGWVWRGQNTPAELPLDRGPWFRNMWLSDRDFLHLMDCCLTATLPQPFLVVNGMSDNTGMAWDLSDTRRLLGYQPKDDVTRS
jgi:NAD+ dependent glucose-6-phosphate dehydrogenase